MYAFSGAHTPYVHPPYGFSVLVMHACVIWRCSLPGEIFVESLFRSRVDEISLNPESI